jgi:hypothetical protein
MKGKPTSAIDSQPLSHIQSHKYFALRNGSSSAGKLHQRHHKRHTILETWRRRYWEDAYPNSVAGEMTDEMIDIDKALNFEASIKRESQDLI